MSANNGSSPPSVPSLSPLETAVWRTIVYSDVFDYPLTLAEIHRYLEGVAATPAAVENALNNGRLLPNHLVYQPPFYMLSGREEIAQIRQRRATISQALWPAAVQYGRLIASLPFVRMVAVTGSLAVNNIDEGADADIDYLVVTQSGRVWLSRAFIIGIVRLAARRGYALCPNYILAEAALAFPDQNLYTARELLQTVPLYGLTLYQKMRQVNTWTRRFMPNAVNAPLFRPNLSAPYPFIQKMIELPWRTPAGRWLDNWEMRRKIRKFSSSHGSHEADFHKDWCKGHFDAHKQRVLSAFYDRSHTKNEISDG
ncbi:MAG: hypothetical protein R6X32_11205 [Chloroflexota bacterium]